MERRFLTIAELAERWRTTIPGIYQMRHRGEGPPSLCLGGKKVLYDEADVVAWEDAQRCRA